MEAQDNVIDSVTVCEMLNISRGNLRQFVFRKILVPVGRHKRRSLFNRVDVEAVKLARTPSIPSV